jgi:hypothetical protein
MYTKIGQTFPTETNGNSTKTLLGDGFLFLESKIVNDEYTNFIYNSYDIQNKEKTTHKINIKNLY